MNKTADLRCLLLILLLIPTSLFAGESPVTSEVAKNGSVDKQAVVNVQEESATSKWLEMQRSGSQASKQKQTLSGPVMENIYERYKESFNHPIPESKEQGVRQTK